MELGAQYPLEQSEASDGMSTRIYANLEDIKTGGRAIYYFDRATLNPIAASYYIVTDIYQHVEMALSLGSVNFEGTMDPRNLMIVRYNYWFTDYFEDC